MKALPEGVEPYRETPEFSESTIPAGLLGSHTTKAGVWARIRVFEGSLRYRILEPELEIIELEPGRDGIIEPCVPHQIEACGPVRFRVEFLRA